MRRLAIIPARGGSKRIPRKNIKSFLGKPIMAYSIEAALDSQLFDEVMVSTDDHEIAEIASQCGAKIPFMRNMETADDFATTADVLTEVIMKYQKIELNFDSICCIYSTAPFVNAEKLKKSCELFEQNNFDTLIPVVKYGFPIQRSVRISDNNRIEFNYPQYQNSRSQDLSNHYHDVGQFYWLKSLSFLKNKSVWTQNTGAFVVPETESQDIDEIADWKIAEMKYRLLHGK